MTAHTADDGLNISIHAAREGGDGHAAKPCYTGCISIHAAREGGDRALTFLRECMIFQSTPPVKAATRKSFAFPPSTPFQSTPPVKAATLTAKAFFFADFISIHAAREGGDVCVGLFFNPAAPFQSTPPVKAATVS